MNNKDLIKKFYTSFSEGRIKEMMECYHEDILFQDPAFGKLQGERAIKMWEMLVSQKSAHTKISFGNIQATTDHANARWIAEYRFGKKKRKVVNNVNAVFKIKDGKIIEHHDTFDLWKWSKQALGTSGYLLGWTPYMKTKIQQSTNKKLDAFINK